jgi:hypothetical protein
LVFFIMDRLARYAVTDEIDSPAGSSKAHRNSVPFHPWLVEPRLLTNQRRAIARQLGGGDALGVNESHPGRHCGAESRMI